MSRISIDQVETLAIGCVYLLFGKARLDFPGSMVAAPSPFVVVSRSRQSLIDKDSESRFPFTVPGDIWELAVYPVLQEYRSTNMIGKLGRDGYSCLVNQLQALLVEQLQLQGYLYLPIETGIVSETETLGDPVYPVSGDPAYPLTDEGDTTWNPPGLPKLSYPIVD